MKKVYLFILIVFVIFFVGCNLNKNEQIKNYIPSDTVLKSFESDLVKYCKILNINMISYAIVNNENVIQVRNLDLTSDNTKEVESTNKSLPIGNIAETMATIIILQQLEAGKVDLKDYLSEYGINDPVLKKVTLKQLLSNTYLVNPGKMYFYDPIRLELLKKVIESVSDDDFQNQLEKGILDVCDMDQTIINNENLIESTINDLAKFSLAIDKKELLEDSASTDLMFRPVYLNNGEMIPASLGWNLQIYNDKKFAWSFGTGSKYSSLIIKSLSDGLTFIVIANSSNLNLPFHLEEGYLLKSPIADLFLKTISYHAETFPTYSYNLSDSLKNAVFSAINKSKHKNLLINELKSNIILNFFMGNTLEHDRLLKLYNKYYSNDIPFNLLVSKPLASIENVGDYVNINREFSVENDTTIAIFAVGEFVKELYMNPWEYDNIEIFLDLHNNKKSTFDNKVHRHYRFTYDYPELTGNYSSGEKIVFAKSDPSKPKYLIEISMPWTTLDSIHPQTGTRLGFDISIGDNDGNMRETCINWIFEKQQKPWENPSIYGTLILSDILKDNYTDSVCTSLNSVSPIAIDGKIDQEWNKAVTYSFTKTTADNMPDNKDISGNFKTMWDNHNLYFLVEITDDIKKLLPTSADYGWIESEKGDTIWKMQPSNTKFAGGDESNRFVNTTIKLKKGKYTLNYSSNQSNSSARWTVNQPDASFYGIAVY